MCANCLSTLTTPVLSASDLNDRFHLNVEREPSDDGPFEDVYYFQISNDRYFDTDDIETFFEDQQFKNKFFSLFINVHGLNVMKNFIALVALIESLPKKSHIIAINETWIKENEEGPFNNLNGYIF